VSEDFHRGIEDILGHLIRQSISRAFSVVSSTLPEKAVAMNNVHTITLTSHFIFLFIFFSFLSLSKIKFTK